MKTIMEEAKDIVAKAKAKGLLGGDVKSVPLHECGTYGGVKFTVSSITPTAAAQWLEKSNQGNRKIRPGTVRAFRRDILAGEWLVNHQGIAFDETGRLIDGQHRLSAIVAANRTVTMLVSTGWPVKHKGRKSTTMDTVDRGNARTVADTLQLNHAMTEAKFVQMAVNIICLLAAPKHNNRASTALTLDVVNLFAPHIAWAIKHRSDMPGLRAAAVLGASVLCHAVDQAAAEPFFASLYEGHGLSKGSPILTLRNHLLSASKSGGKQGQVMSVGYVLTHFAAYQAGRTLDAITRRLEDMHAVLAPIDAKLKAVRAAMKGDQLP
jgi:hypothetical protein